MSSGLRQFVSSIVKFKHLSNYGSSCCHFEIVILKISYIKIMMFEGDESGDLIFFAIYFLKK